MSANFATQPVQVTNRLLNFREFQKSHSNLVIGTFIELSRQQCLQTINCKLEYINETHPKLTRIKLSRQQNHPWKFISLIPSTRNGATGIDWSIVVKSGLIIDGTERSTYMMESDPRSISANVNTDKAFIVSDIKKIFDLFVKNYF